MFKIPPHIRKHFLTDRGRAQLMTFGTVCGCVITGVNWCSQTLWIDKYRDFMQLYRKGLATPVSDDVKSIGLQVMNDMKLTPKYKSYVELFSVVGFDVFFLGSLTTRQGAYIGIPGNYSYKSPSDVEKFDIMVDAKPVPWHTEEGRLLQESIVLSENAQKFAIARQIAHLDTHHIQIYSILSGLPVFMYTFLSIAANTKLYGLYKPASFRIVTYSFVISFVFGIYWVSKDLLTKHYEKRADGIASAISPEYAAGGVEFYAKALQRNIALRSIRIGGESKFTMYGNESEFLRQKHVPLTIRKENVEKVLRNQS